MQLFSPIALILVIFASVQDSFALNVLFVGNSLSASLGGVFQSIAQNVFTSVTFTQDNPGGFSLRQHVYVSNDCVEMIVYK